MYQPIVERFTNAGAVTPGSGLAELTGAGEPKGATAQANAEMESLARRAMSANGFGDALI